MTPEALFPYFLGPFALLVFLLVLVFGLATRRYFVPLTYFEASEKRVEMLEQENANRNDAVVDLTRQNGRLEGEVALLRQEVQGLRIEVARLSGRA